MNSGVRINVFVILADCRIKESFDKLINIFLNKYIVSNTHIARQIIPVMATIHLATCQPSFSNTSGMLVMVNLKKITITLPNRCRSICFIYIIVRPHKCQNHSNTHYSTKWDQ
jgi:hypothetical protein